MHNTLICLFVFGERSNKLTMVSDQNCEQKSTLDNTDHMNANEMQLF